MAITPVRPKHFLLVSDFDQTLSFNDSGLVLSELIGASGFQDKVAGLARTNLVQQGGELAYLIRHDPDFRGVRREHLVEAGRRVRLRRDIPVLMDFLERGVEGCQFSFFVVSAAPKVVIQSALSGIVAPEHIFGTEFDYDPESAEVRSIVRAAAGYGKVSVVEELEAKLGTEPDRTIYVAHGGDPRPVREVRAEVARLGEGPHRSRHRPRGALDRRRRRGGGVTLSPRLMIEALGWAATAVFVGS